MKRFALIGLAGYIAPRHLKAIQDTGNLLVAALDKHDSVGIIDKYFPEASFFTEFERFDRHCEKLRREDHGKEIDFLTICSPNYLHDSHIRFGLRLGCDVICEKPVAINPWNLKTLMGLELETGKKVYTVLQLRHHPVMIELKNKVQANTRTDKYDIELTYMTPRGTWYFHSWKADEEKSGGVATNIGIHFFDILTWIFGKAIRNEVYYKDKKKMLGFLELERARVKWFLSLDRDDLPQENLQKNKPYRKLLIDDEELEFSEGFTDLHTEVYKNIFAGKGFGLADALTSVQIVRDIRDTPVIKPQDGYAHRFLEKLQTKR